MNRLAHLALSYNRSALLRLRALGKKADGLRGRKPLPRHLEVGERGELEALFFLRRLGYHVVERRWHSPEQRGDLDLIAWEGETLCFVEVKTRSVRDLTPAASAVDDVKRRTLRRLGRAYLRTQPRALRHELPVRMDLVSVYLAGEGPECELIRGAVPWRDDNFSQYGV